MSLRNKTLAGLVWTFSQQFGVQLISFLITIILARILAPAEFGIIAMLTVFIAVGSLLVEGGLSSSLIRTGEANQKDFSTVFFFNLAGSIVIYCVVYLAAPLISKFYHQDILTAVLRVYSLVFILNAFYGIQNARLVKDMNFKTQALIQVPSVLSGGLLGIIMAKNGYGVWSLVAMNLCQSFITTLFHWIYSDWRPSLLFDQESFKKHFNFGYKMTLSGLIDVLYKNIYVLIIGKNYPATQLGYYSRADSISQLPTSNISMALNKVTYPMFASISEDNIRLKMVYKKLMQQVIFWNASILLLLVVIAEPLFRFLITAKWLPAVPYFQILCLSGIFYPLHAYNLNILKVKGRSDLFLKLEIIKKVLSVIGILIIIPYGIYGLLYFQLFFNIVAAYINSIYSGELINYPVNEQLSDITPTIILSTFVALICYFLDAFMQKHYQLSDLARIMIEPIIFYSVYLSFSQLLQFNALHDFKQLVLKR